MFKSLPLDLILAWSVFVASCLAQTYHERNIQRGVVYASVLAQRAVEISTGLAVLGGVSLIVYYFIMVAWYLPLAMMLSGVVIGGIGLGLVSNIINLNILSGFAFVTWPLSIAWAVQIIHGL